MTAGRRTLLPCLLLACAFLAGCRNRNQQLLESELRTKETLYRETLHELKRIEGQNETLLREVAAIRQCPPGQLPPPELAAPTFGLRRITLGRGTGGYDNDNLPGDEALQVVIEPRDGDEHVVKVPGSLHVTAVEVNRQGLKNPLCWWTLTPEQLRPFWKQGLLSTGYAVILPWTAFPHCESVRVTAQFKLLDGRLFEADKDVKVRPLPIVPPAGPVLPMPTPQPTPFVLPSSGVQETRLQWSAAPLTNAVDLRPPLPLPPPSGPATPVVIPDE